MKERLRDPKKTESPTLKPEQSQSHSRSSNAVQNQPHSQKPVVSLEKENIEFQKCKLEVTKLEVQAKHGPLTPEQQKHLTGLKEKMKGLLQKIKKEASDFGHNLNNFAINRPDTSYSQPEKTNQTGDKKEELRSDTAVNQLASSANEKDGLVTSEAITQKPESIETTPELTEEKKDDIVLGKTSDSNKEESLKNESLETKSTENKPTETKSIETKPTEIKPLEDKPTENKSVEDKPKENKSQANKSKEDDLKENKPTENNQADKKQEFLKKYPSAKDLVHNIDEKLPQDKILQQLLNNFGKIDFKYITASKSYERLLQGAKEGDSQTLAGAFKAIAQEYFGITNIGIGKISEPFLTEAGKIPHKGYEANCDLDDGKKGWFFQNHYWAEYNGKVYDVLF
jgi:hypothetical protein